MKTAVVPAATLRLVGPVHMVGAVPLGVATVKVAAVVVAGEPTPLAKTASYLLPPSPSVAAPKSNVREVWPVIGTNELLPAVSTIHCTVGVGVPLAAAMNVTSVPAVSD